MKHTVLCVDDEVDNLDALERIFRRKYSVLKSTSGPLALQLLDQHPEPVAVIITDQRMPQMTGTEFLALIKDKYPESLRILLTGYTDMESIIAAVNRGEIYRYLNKPWDPVDLEATVDRAVERFELRRNLKLKNDELQKAFDELKTLDLAKSQFMMLINHELKTPLTTILSYAELLKETELTEDQELYLQRLMAGGDRLKSLVEDVLVVVAAETGKLPLHQQGFLDESLHWYLPPAAQQLAREKKVLIQTHWQRLRLVSDRKAIEQVLSRLLHNAVKFCRTETVISVTLEKISANRVKIIVANQGPLIRPELIERIRQPFFLDEDAMHHSVGMGLGLTICHAYLQALGSELQIANLSDGVEASFLLALEK